MVSCAGRGSNMYRGKAHVESDIWRSVFHSAPCAGFFAGGELGPDAMAGGDPESLTRAKAMLQGFTTVFGCFYTPKVDVGEPVYLVESGGNVEDAVARMIAARQT